MKFAYMYFRKRKISILVFAIFVIIFAAVFFLYELPLEAVIYPACICALTGAVILFLNYKKALCKHIKLMETGKLSSALMERFPDRETQDDIDYQNIIEALRDEINDLETKADLRYQDTVDYYTTWVHQIKTPIASMRLTLQNEDSDTARQISDDLFRIEQYVDMVAAGIIDPAKVTRSALQNAVSVASTLLTTEAAVVEIPAPEPAMPAGGAGGMM